MATLSIALVLLQYKWTGQIAEAEMKERQNDSRMLASRLTREFDEQLASACDALMPTDATSDLAPSIEACWRQWQSQQPRPIFARIGFARREKGQLIISLLDFTTGTFKPSAVWPSEWQELKISLDGKTGHGPRPFFDRAGLLLEFPMQKPGKAHDDPHGSHDESDNPTRGGITGWLITQLDANEITTKWLPELIQKHFNSDGANLYQVQVDGIITPRQSIKPYSWDFISWEHTAEFNCLGKTNKNSIAMATPVWTLRVRPVPGALDEIVSATRRKNMLVASILAALLLAAGITVVMLSRRASQLALARLNFVATVSHELRTPLTVICGAAHNLERSIVPPEKAKNYASMIGQHAKQLSNLIEQVLDFAQVEREGLNLKLEPHPTSAFLHETLAIARLQPLLNACTIESDIPCDLPPILADAAALRRAIFNLLNNAATHTCQPWMRLTARAVTDKKTGGRIEIAVQDRGSGIPAAEHAAIFEPFYRGAAARVAQTRGSGIGLSVVKEIIAAHHGSIRLHSVAAEGSTFLISLPCQPQ